MNVVQFYRQVYADNRGRREGRRHLGRDLLLYARNCALRPLERRLIARHRDAERPIVFIVGVPRSGTTVLYQLLSALLDVGYVSNYVARYWMAPVAGSVLYRRRFGDAPPTLSLDSNLGAAPGPDAPHEFSWFWQFWASLESSDHLTDAELARIDWAPVVEEVQALAGWHRATLALKCLNHVNYHIPWFASLFPSSHFVHIRRTPDYVVQSILEARARRYGTERHWWSIRPRDHRAWRDRDPVAQVCHQVVDCTGAIERGLADLPAARRHALDYEALVRSPGDVLDGLARELGLTRRRGSARMPKHLAGGNVVRDERFERFARQLAPAA